MYLPGEAMSEPYKPHDYQKQAIKFLISNGQAGLFLDPGLGKTSITFAAFKLLRKQGMVNKMLVVAPLRPAHSVWPQESQKWADFADLKVRVLHGDERVLRPDNDVDVINPEGLKWLFGEAKAQRRWPWEMLVIDESTQFKHTDTQRFKILKPWLPRFLRRYILTGSPAPNGLMDLFGQVYVLDRGHALGQYITHYRREFFDQTGFNGYEWKLRQGSEDKIYERLKPLVLRLSAADYLDLPPLIENVVRVDLPPGARKAYDQMEELLIAELDDGVVTAATASAATNKCRQIANGGIYGAEDEWKHVHDAKTEAVQDIVEELGGKPAFVAYEFKHDLARLQKAFPDAPYLGGGVPPKRARELEDAWNAGFLPVLFAQPQSVAHGLNLQGVGAAVIWHSLTWNLEHDEQLVRRVWRQGQKERVVVHRIVASNTVDDVILRTVRSKDRTQKALLGALRDSLDARQPTRRRK